VKGEGPTIRSPYFFPMYFLAEMIVAWFVISSSTTSRPAVTRSFCSLRITACLEEGVR